MEFLANSYHFIHLLFASAALNTIVLRLIAGTGHDATLFGQDWLEFGLSLLTNLHLGCIPIGRPSTEDTSYKKCAKMVLASLKGYLRRFISHAGDLDSAIVDKNFAVEPKSTVESEEFIDAILGNIDKALYLSGVILDTTNATWYFLDSAHAFETGSNAVNGPGTTGDVVTAELKVAIGDAHVYSLNRLLAAVVSNGLDSYDVGLLLFLCFA